ncbi:Glycosyl transferase family 2 [Vreelandella titanicae]|uniref:glycosyltransferase n=1 Tax=Vreelandella titanicae TaxID=664683 RepID=UPI0008870F11|nr:glycosyltransferase [Halomonas titanicae]SDI96480.1 Glycosyl transferase family 2 [Halomonas titanicae]
MSDANRKLLLDAELFNASWYVNRYLDAQHSQLSPLEHFLNYGWALGRCPGPGFDPEEYSRRYPDVATSGLSPLLHYLRHGRSEGRRAVVGEGHSPAVPQLAVVLHAYHLELVALLGDRLALLKEPFDLFITTSHAPNTREIVALKKRYPGAKVVHCPNRGRDIAPFFSLIPHLQQYTLCLKLHTKQGVTPVAKQWRDTLLSSVLPSGGGVQALLHKLRSDPRLQLAGPQRLFMSQLSMRFGNGPWLEKLAPRVNVSLESDWGFFAGSMFWCRPQALSALAAEVAPLMFEPETGEQDGELSHALERLVGGVVRPQSERVLLLPHGSNGELSPYQMETGLESTMPSELLIDSSDLQELQVLGTSGVKAARKQGLNGDLNLNGDLAICGWLADSGSSAPRSALIRIDGHHDIEVIANQFRNDLRDNGIHEGRHAFETYPPVELVDGQNHHLELIDTLSGHVVASGDAVWEFQRSFSDFAGYLAHGLVDPYLSRPFREADKRCLAAMENVADGLTRNAQALAKAPLVTVIMPCFNRLDTIEAAVESVSSQVYANWELLLVDDGSTDGTREWCERQAAKNERIQLIALKKNRGVSHARNQGLEVAQGAYIAYLDSDNVWDPRYLAAMVGAFSREPTAQAFYSGLYRYTGNATEPSGVLFGPLNRALLFNRNYVDLNAFCHTREAYQQCGGFDETLPRFVDWDLIRRYSQRVRLCSVPVVLTHYYYGRAANTLTANTEYVGYLDQVREATGHQWSTAKSTASTALQRGVSVVIPSYESLEDLRDCLTSLEALALGDKLEVIVVDNDSSSPVKKFLEEAQAAGRLKAIFNSCNYGFTHAVNLGLAAAKTDHDLMLLNNDAQVEPGALEAMQLAATQLPECGLVVPQQILPGGTPTLTTHVPYADADQPCDVNLSAHHSNIVTPPLVHDGRVLEISFAPFFCVYIPRETYRSAGPLDAQFGRHYRSDRIYCDVVRHLLGLRIYHVSDACVVHKLQKSTRVLSGRSNSQFDLMFRKNQWDEPTRRTLGFRKAVWDL